MANDPAIDVIDDPHASSFTFTKYARAKVSAGLISSAIACHSVRSPMVCQGCARFRKRFICPPVALQSISIVEFTQRVFDSRRDSNDPVCKACLKESKP